MYLSMVNSNHKSTHLYPLVVLTNSLLQLKEIQDGSGAIQTYQVTLAHINNNLDLKVGAPKRYLANQLTLPLLLTQLHNNLNKLLLPPCSASLVILPMGCNQFRNGGMRLSQLVVQVFHLILRFKVNMMVTMLLNGTKA